ADLAPVRAGVRHRGLLSGLARGGGPARRSEPDRLPLADERPWAARLEPPLAGRAAARRERRRARRPLGGRAPLAADPERARPAGAADLRQPRDGGTRGR